MLLRNLRQIIRLCNNTRLQVKQIKSKTLDCRILDNKHNNQRYFIPRISLASPNTNNLYTLFQRVQYLIRLAFNITINKSQKQSLQHVGLYLQPKIFAYNQLYIILSRVINKTELLIVALGELLRRQLYLLTRYIKNIVIKDVLLSPS